MEPQILKDSIRTMLGTLRQRGLVGKGEERLGEMQTTLLKSYLTSLLDISEDRALRAVLEVFPARPSIDDAIAVLEQMERFVGRATGDAASPGPHSGEQAGPTLFDEAVDKFRGLVKTIQDRSTDLGKTDTPPAAATPRPGEQPGPTLLDEAVDKFRGLLKTIQDRSAGPSKTDTPLASGTPHSAQMPEVPPAGPASADGGAPSPAADPLVPLAKTGPTATPHFSGTRIFGEGFAAEWARSKRIVLWAGFLAAFGANIIPALLRVPKWGNEERIQFFMLVPMIALAHQFYIPWLRKIENQRLVRKGLPPRWPPEPAHAKKRGFWSILYALVIGLLTEGLAHVTTDHPMSSLFAVFPPAAVVTWFWLRGAEKRPSQAAQFGGTSGVIAGVVCGYAFAVLLFGGRARPELIWALVLANAVRYGVLGLAGGLVIDRGLGSKYEFAVAAGLVAASPAAFLLVWLFRFPVGLLDFLFALLLGAGWGIGVLVGQQSQAAASHRAPAVQPSSIAAPQPGP
jgi:hypothetical protein